MRVTIVLEKLPSASRRWVFAVAELVFLIYSVIVCFLGIQITQNAFAQGKILSSTEWPLGYLYAAIIFSGGLSALRLCHSLYQIVVLGEVKIQPQSEVEV